MPWHGSDTLLNVFLAIAVDNLGNAQALTAAEERAELSEQVNLLLYQSTEVCCCKPGIPQSSA